MTRGVVKEYDRLKGFGFIAGGDGEDYFVHVCDLREHHKGQGLRSWQKDSFEIDRDIKDDRAVNVRID